MKKLLLLLLLGVVLSACEERYQYNYDLKYTVNGQEYVNTGTIISDVREAVPIAVALNNGIVVDMYPGGYNGKIVIYQGSDDFRITQFNYWLEMIYNCNLLTGDIYNRRKTQSLDEVTKEEEK